MSYDREAPKPLVSGGELGLTMAAGTVTAGGAYVMSDEKRDELYLTALAADVTGRFTRPMGRVEDQPLRREDGYGDGWCRRQRAAAARLGALWKAAVPGIDVPGGYPGGGKGGGTLSQEEEEAAHVAFKAYSEAMAQVERQCSMQHANAVRMVIIYAEPSPQSRAWMVREALLFLADWWRVK
ncbi:hypothetical protein [Roseomonas populi]|uniref:Uncharacterized protein n=1 Tax=Roseomonas populi TaxID=3121582 RepID=A0ABT1X253_9PROT|nr:hypothetical protein [Roseomonas pecuniae]MCR0981804.1 hypothetical protein [Roseomonas pecuniae]